MVFSHLKWTVFLLNKGRLLSSELELCLLTLMHCLAVSLGFGSSTLGFVPQKSDTYGRPAASDLTHNQSMLALRHISKFQRAVVVFLYPQWRWEKMTYLPQKWAEKKKPSSPPNQECPLCLGVHCRDRKDQSSGLAFGNWSTASFPSIFWIWEPAFGMS